MAAPTEPSIAEVLYGTDDYRKTMIVSDIPPPDMHILRELSARSGASHDRNAGGPQRNWGSGSTNRSRPTPYSRPSNLSQRSDSDRHQQRRRSPSPQKVFRTNVKILYETPVSWLCQSAKTPPPDSWIQHATIHVHKAAPIDYSLLCYPDLVNQLVSTKKKLADLEKHVFNTGRDAANPYELLGKSVFINRSAVKMAGLDAQFNFLRLNLKTSNDHGLEFADLCSGPGGFTEYILWRKYSLREPVRGWGITLRGDQDFKFKQMIVPPGLHPHQNFEPFYGTDGTGDIYNDANINAFVAHVLQATGERGVDLVLADGGFSVLGDELYQEEHSHQLMLCQVLSMFRILKKGGSFVLKCFDLVTPLSGELVYILHLHFERIAILKPLASRPANAERYIVCENLVSGFPQSLIDHLHACNARFNLLRSSTIPAVSAHNHHQPGFGTRQERIELELQEVSDLFDRSWMLKDEEFVDFLQASNMKMAVKQREAIQELLKYAGCAETPVPLPFDQIYIRDQCLKAWQLPVLDIPEAVPTPRSYTSQDSNTHRTSEYIRYGRDDRHRRTETRDRHSGYNHREDTPYRRTDTNRYDGHGR
ncbi:hypothetical protein BASA50_003613 [Batrachochytrium salamandrivorans]|uniref:Cap-specific mRNA (nucleoside-2'-O-)-methyltransferase 1 n=1 Tax=Batrachochytrium salamandrivorans TaxID=1357716 RepID=A0ABQ8FI03_9FUNG|nr:hypothetical protein BASA60_008067 [Batrachochytrium salamandrivorans]KAH6598575.1 hypothetical protein BASA50_003613 [Batrachochytrium salamandrivorans]KAH6600752.1 hypothetical protein BASA61_002169 [Batrachochytrium salamandrivorans]KAH9266559.1 hypothetical protein BASA84_001045 [Batrachochytrium salamandrivorans]